MAKKIVKKKVYTVWVAGREVTPVGWSTYIKKPIPVKAIKMEARFMVDTMEGAMWGKAGDYLIKGIKGELYPCDEEIFHATYKKLRRGN